MILFLYNNKIINQGLLDYLLRLTNNIKVISFQQLKEIPILDSIQESTTWYYQDQTIDFNDITGIYNEISYLNLKEFENYVPADREYVCAEWIAYLMFLMQKYHNRVFNPFNHYILSGDIFNLPFMYNMCSRKGLATPRVVLSMDRIELEEILQNGDYIPLTNLTEKLAFQKCDILPPNCIGLIEYSIGSPIIVHVLDDMVFTCELDGSEKKEYNLPAEIKQACIQITSEVGLKLSEFIFKKETKARLILYRFSHAPRFMNNSPSNVQDIYSYLGNKLINNLG